VSCKVDEDPGWKRGRLLHKVVSAVVPDVEQVGFTHVSDEPVSIATLTVCWGVPIETKSSSQLTDPQVDHVISHS
jgi:hypothetical protein